MAHKSIHFSGAVKRALTSICHPLANRQLALDDLTNYLRFARGLRHVPMNETERKFGRAYDAAAEVARSPDKVTLRITREKFEAEIARISGVYGLKQASYISRNAQDVELNIRCFALLESLVEMSGAVEGDALHVGNTGKNMVTIVLEMERDGRRENETGMAIVKKVASALKGSLRCEYGDSKNVYELTLPATFR